MVQLKLSVLAIQSTSIIRIGLADLELHEFSIINTSVNSISKEREI